MITVILLASFARCAASNLCPTDNEIRDAARAWNDSAVQAISDQLAAEEPEQIHLVHAQRIRRISDVLCGEALGEDGPTIICKFTIRYASGTTFQMAKMKKTAQGWEIIDALSVSQNR
jgi:hypothetical protein